MGLTAVRSLAPNYDLKLAETARIKLCIAFSRWEWWLVSTLTKVQLPVVKYNERVVGVAIRILLIFSIATGVITESQTSDLI